MPSKRQPAAPANRVYKSSIPLQQSRFPVRSTSVKYGKQTSKRVPKQETLTQMAFMSPDHLLNFHDDGEGMDGEQTEKPKKKRRKTTGDVPSSESKHHTQTLTQIDWSFSKELEELEDNDAVYDIMSSSPQSKEVRRQRSESSKPQVPVIQRSEKRKSAPGLMGPPQTPRKRFPREIPSSESPTTPQFRSSHDKSALSDRSVNLPISFNIHPKAHSPVKLPILRIEDTFESDEFSQIQVSMTPSKKSSPVKSVKWAEVDEIHQFGHSFPPVDEEEASEEVIDPPSTSIINEILDSQDEGEYEAPKNILIRAGIEAVHSETCYGDFGVETQKLLESQDLLVPQSVEESQVPGVEMLENLQEDSHFVDEGQTLACEIQERAPEREVEDVVGSPSFDESMVNDLIEERTQYMESQRLATQHVHSMAPRTRDSDVFVSMRPENVTKIVDRTKNHEFRHQKISETVSRMWIYEISPTRSLQYMAVISGTKRPGEVEDENGIGNVEFNAKDPNCGEFAWEILELYELADPLPWTTIVANDWLHQPPRTPIFVRPAVLDQLMANLKPAIFCQTVLVRELSIESCTDTQEAENQLLGTIKQYTQLDSGPCTLSSQYVTQEHKDEEGHSHNNQEYEKDEEPRNYNKFPDSTQMPTNLSPYHSLLSSSQHNSHTEDEDSQVLPLRHDLDTLPPAGKSFTQCGPPTFSQAETVDLSPCQTPRHQHPSSDIILESPTRLLLSSTPATLPSLHDHPERMHSTVDSIVPYSMNSSQLLTKSQMLPASLLQDSAPRLPLCIQDSDEEEGF